MPASCVADSAGVPHGVGITRSASGWGSFRKCAPSRGAWRTMASTNRRRGGQAHALKTQVKRARRRSGASARLEASMEQPAGLISRTTVALHRSRYVSEATPSREARRLSTSAWDHARRTAYFAHEDRENA